MKKFYNSMKSRLAVLVGSVAGVAAAVPAHAAIDLTGVSVDTADYISIATFLITALVAFWGIRKGLALLNK